jgi:tRNA(adenine34) deaminase
MSDEALKALDEQDRVWMAEAQMLARQAGEEGEVPIGAIIVRGGAIIGRGWNRNIGLNDPSAHAEIMAMRDAGKTLGNHRLPGCSLYVTLEPCPMCAGAMIHARLARVVFGADDPKTGAAGGMFNLLGDAAHNHVVEVSGGCLAEESSAMLKEFFKKRR